METLWIKMKQGTKGIPTKYKGIQFRSRLEAKWAAFFDLMHWKWQYEPCDFNGWIPDFVLFGREHSIYVEVKPVSFFPKEVADKVERSGCNKDILIVGLTTPLPERSVWDIFEYNPTDLGGGFIGWLWESGDCGWGEMGWNAAPYSQSPLTAYLEAGCSYTDDRIGFIHPIGSYEDRITGIHDGDHHLHFNLIDKEKISQLWAVACNKTQWKKKSGRLEG